MIELIVIAFVMFALVGVVIVATPLAVGLGILALCLLFVFLILAVLWRISAAIVRGMNDRWKSRKFKRIGYD